MSNDAPPFSSTPRVALASVVPPAHEEMQLSWLPPPGMVALSFKNFPASVTPIRW